MSAGLFAVKIPQARRAPCGLEKHITEITLQLARIVTGDVDVLRLDCNHLSVVREPHIGDIVDAIDTVLRDR